MTWLDLNLEKHKKKLLQKFTCFDHFIDEPKKEKEKKKGLWGC